MEWLSGILSALVPGLPGWAAGAGALLLVLLGLSLWLTTGRLAWRLILRFVFGIVVPLALVVGGGLFVLSRLVPLYPLIWQIITVATILAVTAVGLVITRQRDAAEERRALARILHDEIAGIVAADGPDETLAEYGRQMLEVMKANPGFVPLMPAEVASESFAALLPRLTTLPPNAAGAVAAFHAQTARLVRLVADMRGAAFGQIAAERRINMYRDFIALKRARLELGGAALGALEKVAGGSRDVPLRSPRAGL